MTRVLITGGGGLVGQFITRRFLSEGWQVACLSRNAPKLSGVQHLPFTLGETPVLPPATVLVHCAFDHAPGRYRGGEGDDPDKFRKRNLDGTLRLFDAAEAALIPQVIFLSSRAVYGDYPAGTALDETLPPRPDSLYGQVKLAAERALADMASAEFRTISLRATGVYGPSNSGAHKWSGLFTDFLNGNTIAPRIATEVHGDDLADAVWRLKSAPNGVYNASDITLDRHDLLALVAQGTGCPHALPDRADATKVNTMTTAKLRATGWHPGGMTKLAENIPKLLEHVGP